MSQHTSFGTGSAGGSHRSVLKRYEKLEVLQKKGLWSDDQGCLGLPKVRVMKIKAKKDKAVAAEGEAGAKDAKAPVTGAPAAKTAAPAAGKAAPAAKAAAPAKDAKAKSSK